MGRTIGERPWSKDRINAVTDKDLVIGKGNIEFVSWRRVIVLVVVVVDILVEELRLIRKMKVFSSKGKTKESEED